MPFETNQAAYEKAALLVAQGELTYVQIAELVDITRETLWAWRKEPEFERLVQEHIVELVDVVREFGIGKLHYRVRARDRRHKLLMSVIDERAKCAPGAAIAPGAATGLLVHTVKSIGSGENAEKIDEYKVDVGLLAELRALEFETAKELGQWVDRQETKSQTTVMLEDEDMADWMKADLPPEPTVESAAPDEPALTAA